MNNELTNIVLECKMDCEGSILSRFQGLDQKFGPEIDLTDPDIDKVCYEGPARKEAVEVLDVIFSCIGSDFLQYEKEDVEKALRIASSWAKAYGIDVSEKVQDIQSLMADVEEPDAFEKAMFENDMKVFVEAFAIHEALTKENPDIDGEEVFRIAEEIVKVERRERKQEIVCNSI